MIDMSVTSLLSGVDRLRSDSARVDGGLNRVRSELTRLRGETGASLAGSARAFGDVTDIRGDLSEVSRGVTAFRGAATQLRDGLCSTTPDAVRLQAQQAADSATRHAAAVDSGISDVSDAVSGLQHGAARP